jgi:hypothetical protein
MFSFWLDCREFWFPLFLQWPTGLGAMLFSPQLFIFCCFFCWGSSLFHCQAVYIGLFHFSYICYDLVSALKCDMYCRKFHGLLKEMCIMLLFDETLCRCLSGPFFYGVIWFWSLFVDFFVLMTCILWQWNIKVSQYHCIGVYFKPSSVCLMRLCVPTRPI